MNKHDERLFRGILAVGAILAVICMFYCEEDWRGHYTWNKLKRQLEARGAHVDWTNYVRTPVPPDQNFFGEPKMQRWFTGRGGNDLSSKLDAGRSDFLAQYGGDAVAEVRLVKRAEKIAPNEADVVLSYDRDLGVLMLQQPDSPQTTTGEEEVIPLIKMEYVPLDDAIKALARQAGINYVLDSNVASSGSESGHAVTERWENITARHALKLVMDKYNLEFTPDAKTGVGRIGAKKNAAGKAGPAKEQLESLVLKAIEDSTNHPGRKSAYTAMGVTLVADRAIAVKPVRVVVRTDEALSTNEVAAFFPSLPNAYYPSMHTQVESVARGSNTFQIRLNPPPAIAAADYLKWSDALEPEFALIREAAKRPYAQMEGDYTIPSQIPIPNFVCQRIVAQTLTDRAKCHLLAGQPGAALQDLVLVRELCRVMEGRPAERPMTLVATMINCAITGLYVDTVAEGMRLQAWREPELAALQEQLKQINLPPLLAESFEWERAASCRSLETAKADDVEKWTARTPSSELWEKLKNPTYLIFKVGPRGWVYQNMSKIAQLDAAFLNGFDPTNGVVSPARMDGAMKSVSADLNQMSPYNYLAEVMVPNFTRAVQILTRNQCMVEEGIAACGLERYRLAHGEYPKMLATLVPQYLEKIPVDIVNGQPLKYHVKDDGKFALYSVGWNEKDDGGIPGPQKDGAADVKQNDWVWADSLK